jgi:PPOX class probable F420-dependent enzyme
MAGIDETVARQLLASARVARLATVTPDGRPHIVPVTFAVDGDHIYTAVDAKPKTTRDLQRLRNIQATGHAAVLADHYDDDWAALWWARADGQAGLIGETRLMAGPLALLAGRYPQYREAAPAGPVIDIQVRLWTGWAAAALVMSS